MHLNETVWGTLRELAEVDPTFLPDLVTGFLETADQRVEQLARGDGDTKELAHALRGAALQVGADALAEACEALEIAPERQEELIPQIREQLESTRAALLARARIT